jgi:hypothetical protein
MDDYQEGYADGIAGAGMQDRFTGFGWRDPQWEPAQKYGDGFDAGSFDRKTLERSVKVYDDAGAA